MDCGVTAGHDECIKRGSQGGHQITHKLGHAFANIKKFDVKFLSALFGFGYIIFVKSKAAGIVVITLSGVLGIAGMVALFITSSAVRDFGPDLFGSLPLWLTAGAVALVGVSEGFLWHTVRNFIVK